MGERMILQITCKILDRNPQNRYMGLVFRLFIAKNANIAL
jgi:hypothetical protein